jgi:hypothetical protein
MFCFSLFLFSASNTCVVSDSNLLYWFTVPTFSGISPMTAPSTMVSPALPQVTLTNSGAFSLGSSKTPTVLLPKTNPSSAKARLGSILLPQLCKPIGDGACSSHLPSNIVLTRCANVDLFNANPSTNTFSHNMVPFTPVCRARSTGKTPNPLNNNSLPLSVKNNGWNADAVDAASTLNAKTANTAAKANLMTRISGLPFNPWSAGSKRLGRTIWERQPPGKRCLPLAGARGLCRACAHFWPRRGRRREPTTHIDVSCPRSSTPMVLSNLARIDSGARCPPGPLRSGTELSLRATR